MTALSLFQSHRKTAQLLLFVLMFLFVSPVDVLAQDIPNGFNYQGVARDENGYPIADHDIVVVFSIYKGNPENNAIVWMEKHEVSTNESGFFSVVIGEGTSTADGSQNSFDEINWTSGEYSIGVEVDFGVSNVGNELVEFGTAELQSVPYAFWSRNTFYADTAYAVKGLTLGKLTGIDETNITVGNAIVWAGDRWTTGTVSAGDYLLKNGTTDLTGDWNVNNNNITLKNGTLTAKVLKGTSLKLSNVYEVNAISFDPNLGGATSSDVTLPTQNAVKQYVDNKISGGYWKLDGTYLYNLDNKVGIGTAVPRTKFHAEVGADAFMVTGLYDGTTHTGNWGGGARMAFFPAKAAFRAGFISEGRTFWDSDMVGNYSAAFGMDTKALANQSFAAGLSSTAGGSCATALGRSTEAWGQNSLASGYFANAQGLNSVAFGENTTAVEDNSLALGSRTEAKGIGSIAAGENSLTRGNYSFAMGNAAQTTPSAAYSFAQGNNAKASAQYATAFGVYTQARTYAEFVIGQYNTAYDYNYPPESTSSWNTYDRLFVIGNGTGPLTQSSDAMVVLKSGFVGIGISRPTARLHVAGNIVATGSITGSSDIRYKKNLQPLGSTMAKIQQINAYYYDWRVDEFPALQFSSSRQIGFIAQDIEKIYPEFVVTNDDGYKSVDYGHFTAVLLVGMKEQQLQIDQLKKENEILKAEAGKNADLSVKVSDLEKKVELLMQAVNMKADNSTEKTK